MNEQETDSRSSLAVGLANYALSKAVDEPSDFECEKKGDKENSCHCWNEEGKAEDDSEFCNEPKKCLVYSTESNGDFKFDNVTADGLHAKLDSWNVPSDMYSAFDAAVLLDSADFKTFDLAIGDHKASYRANVGSARKWQGSVYLGYVFGSADGDMVQPKKRNHDECPPGSCHGTSTGMHDRGYTDDEVEKIDKGLGAIAFKKAATLAQPTTAARPGGRMTEATFLAKWGDVVSAVAPAQPAAPRQGDDPFALLVQAIKGVATTWSTVVDGFKSSHADSLSTTEFANGWRTFAGNTKLFKGAGLGYDKADEFFANLVSMVDIPSEYKDEFNAQVGWIKAADNVTWWERNTQFATATGKGGDDTMFTLYARNRPAEQMIDLYFLTIAESFALADDYFVISEHKSIRGGPFDKTAIRTKEVPAGVSTEQLFFVAEYFSLLAAQQLADAEQVGSPTDPTFARSFPYKPRASGGR